tara:strand:- start:51 stop:245 length:195 start_codon:yes stop_codon:yes gene_type:complete
MKTQTTEGWIFHKEWRGIFLPVKVDVTNRKGQAGVLNEVPTPKREHGYLKFALPGGDEIAESEI